MASTSKCDWPKEAVILLITTWSSKECLYNSKHVLHKNKHARQHALSEICESLRDTVPDVTIDDVKSKINNLRSQYSRELTKQRNSARSGAGSEDVYEPNAYWFPHMHFLKHFVATRKGKCNVDDSDYQILEPNLDEQEDALSSIAESQSSKQPPKRRKGTDDAILNQAASALESIASILAAEKENLMDDVHTFGEHIKAELYALDSKEREQLKFQINNLIYQFKMARI